MSGHSKWSTIKHKKAAKDSKRGKVFTKLGKEVTVAAKMGGGDPDGNPRLRAAIAAARSQSMPKDTIDRAIKKGTGELEGVNYEEILYEGYGPENVAIIVEVMTDNRNRTTANIRYAFSRSGGNLGASNSVQYMFDRMGLIYVPKSAMSEDELTEIVLEVGADDLNAENQEEYEITTTPASFLAIRNAIEEKKVTIAHADVEWVPQNRVEITSLKEAEKVIRLIDNLEDDDDVQSVHSNFDISEEVLAQMS